MNNLKKFWKSFAGKGYYMALILCAAAIGITGYLYYRNTANKTPEQVDVAVNGQGGLPVEVGTPEEKNAPEPLKTALPLSGETIGAYAMDCLSYNATTRDWRVHDGVDIAAEAGSPVCAAAAGEVYTVYDDEVWGTTVVIQHEGGYVTTYASLDAQTQVAPGDTVTLGQTIGTVGNTADLETAIGDHLHFSVKCNDEPMDPMEFIG